MNPSDRFSSQVLKIEKQNLGLDDERLVERVRDSFFSHLDELPNELRYDMFEYFYDQFLNHQNKKLGFDEFSSKLKSIIELFNFEYEAGDDFLTNDDWEYIKETVSDYALEIDDSSLTYIMKFVVERGTFDR